MSFLHCCLTTVDVVKKYTDGICLFWNQSSLDRVILLLFSNQNPCVSFLM